MLLHNTPRQVMCTRSHSPCLQIYPHGSGDMDLLLEPMSTHHSLASSPFAQATLVPQHLDLASIHAMQSFTPPKPTLSENMPRELVTHLSMPAAQFGSESSGTEGRVRGGFFKVSSHPDLAAIAETAVQVTPFAGYAPLIRCKPSPTDHNCSQSDQYISLHGCYAVCHSAEVCVDA